MIKVSPFLKISPEVQEALENCRPIVALETTVISHGLPYPENLQLASQIEEIIRSEGASPAMVALFDGFIKIGLTPEELMRIGGGVNKKSVLKVSRKDIPYALAMKKEGATTVSGTMFGASLAGIRIFATGGIGGVHRDVDKTFDISSDLQELARTDVAVVCSGVKSILDIGKTLELLETLGVPVIGYRTEQFPSFYSLKSGHKLEYCLDDPGSMAKVLQTKWSLGLTGGVVIANPIPQEEALDEVLIETCLKEALKKAKEDRVAGKAVTPFLLKELFEKSKGKTLKANLALLKENARVAAQVAVSFSRLTGTSA
jgi:pseudouridine-5'-phosphate glycosidase